MITRLSLDTVNKELARLGFAERLAKGKAHFLFTGGEADEWLARTVGVRTLNSMTLKQWIAEFRRLKAVNEQIMGTGKRSRPPSAAK